MIKSMHILSMVLLLSGTLSYAQDAGLLGQIGKKISPYVPEAAKKWYQQRQEEQERASKEREEREKIHRFLTYSLLTEDKTDLLKDLLKQGMDPNRKGLDYFWQDTRLNLLMIAAANGKKE